jgi:hypothetical protein
MKDQTNQPSEDDGRVICDMDVAGMRWHDKRVRREEREARRAAHPGQQMTNAEARKYTWYAVLAGMTVVGAFAVVWILFVLFCTLVWFR